MWSSGSITPAIWQYHEWGHEHRQFSAHHMSFKLWETRGYYVFPHTQRDVLILNKTVGRAGWKSEASCKILKTVRNWEIFCEFPHTQEFFIFGDWTKQSGGQAGNGKPPAKFDRVGRYDIPQRAQGQYEPVGRAFPCNSLMYAALPPALNYVIWGKQRSSLDTRLCADIWHHYCNYKPVAQFFNQSDHSI